MKATDFFRALDDSDLDPYETRYLMRVWRRGTCWEKLTSIAETVGMSVGKASQVRRDLIAKGWLVEVVADGRVAYQVCIPAVVEVQDVKVDAVVFHEVKESVAEFHEVKPEFHHVKPEFHVVSALPLIDQNEDHTIKASSAAAPLSPVDELAEHFYRKTGFIPDPRRPMNKLDWLDPLASILKMGGGDVEAAKTLIAASIDKAWSTLKGDGAPYPVHTPRSIVKFAANLAATQQTAATVADDDTIWQRALAAVTRRDFTDERLKAAIRAIGGTGRIASANGHDTETLKRSLGHAYRNVAAA